MPRIAAMLPRDLAPELVLPFARRADALGFDELWVVEDLGFRGGIAQAAAALAATERIRVGVGIAPVAARNVAFAAMEFTTLAELFPGRVIAGVGHGMPGFMRAVGAWPTSPLTLFEETTDALRALLRGETVTRDGRYITLDGVRLESPAAIPPEVVAGLRGPKSIAAAARCSDGLVLAEPVTPEYLAAALAHWRAGLEPNAAAPTAATAPEVIAYAVAAVDDDPAVARDAVRPALEWIGEPDWAPHLEPLPFAAEFRALRAECRDRAEFVERMPDAWVDRLATVGRPEDARASIRALHDAGATSVVLLPVGAGPVGPDPIAALESLARVL